jgi:16S rRNA (guanine527-N7)-methyltransferase
MEENIRHILLAEAEEIGIRLEPEAVERFVAYQRELLVWNRRINLVSERSAREIVSRHFLDSLTAVPVMTSPDGLLIDLGSGSGFPGIPLAIALPKLQVVLVESSRKKTSFLTHLIRSLGLGQVSVIRERVEALFGQKACAETFDTVISRAAFKLPELIRMASFFLKPGGTLIAMKGEIPEEEMAQADADLKAAGMAFYASVDILKPVTKTTRKIITYKHLSG